MIPQPTLLPGDILGYAGEAIVRWKTDGLAGHVAVYIGGGQVVTSLTQTGVGVYPMDEQGTLVWIRRPKGVFDYDAAMRYFQIVRGTPYGWNDIKEVAGLSTAVGSGMDCSHTSAKFLEAGGVPQFDETYDQGKVTPRDFEESFESNQIWP